jgi:hypothetical protein
MLVTSLGRVTSLGASRPSAGRRERTAHEIGQDAAHLVPSQNDDK